MEAQKILADLQQVFDELFLEPVKVVRSLSADQVDEWDSFQQISLVVAAEKKFGVRFGTGETSQLKNVGEFVDLILEKLQGGSKVASSG